MWPRRGQNGLHVTFLFSARPAGARLFFEAKSAKRRKLGYLTGAVALGNCLTKA